MAWQERVETCRIVLWRGYATSAFYARSTDDPDGGSVGGPSGSFRWWRGAPPDTPEARAAHLEVVSRLEQEGWTRTGQGREWYATEFARTVLAPVAEAANEPELVPEPAPEPGLFVPPPPPEPEPEAEQEPEPRWEPAPRPPAYVAAGPGRRVDGWRVAAAAGLVTAIALVGWVATHPSALRATAPSPQRAPVVTLRAY